MAKDWNALAQANAAGTMKLLSFFVEGMAVTTYPATCCTRCSSTPSSKGRGRRSTSALNAGTLRRCSHDPPLRVRVRRLP